MPKYGKLGDRMVGISASVPSHLYNRVVSYAYKNGLNFSQAVAEKIQQGFAYTDMLAAQEEVQAQNILGVVKDEAAAHQDIH